MLGIENRNYMSFQITHFTNEDLTKNLSQERIFIF